MKPTTVDQYIQSFPAETQQALQQIRQIIQQAVPQAEEVISYAIPAFKLKGKVFIYFSGAKKHIGLYPFTQELAQALPQANQYDQSGKGTIRFPLDQPLPAQLIGQIALIKAQEVQ